MKLLVDESITRLVVPLLSAAGHEVSHVREVGLGGATDEAIVAWCTERGYVAVTFDKDFHVLLAGTAATSPSVIRLRESKLREEPLARIILAAVERFGAQLAAGAAVSARSERLFGCRLLPLTSAPKR